MTLAYPSPDLRDYERDDEYCHQHVCKRNHHVTSVNTWSSTKFFPFSSQVYLTSQTTATQTQNTTTQVEMCLLINNYLTVD